MRMQRSSRSAPGSKTGKRGVLCRRVEGRRMRDVYVVGAGQSEYGSFPDESYRSLFETAYDRACSSVSGGIDPTDVDEAVIGTLGVGGRQLGLSGPAVTEHVGLHGTPCSRIENACAAGGYA